MQKILIIDDDTYTCKLLANFLDKNGYDTQSAYTGGSALKLIDSHEYQLILSDYRLPDKDGLDILLASKKKSAEIPVIIMTAYENLDTAVKLIKSGAYDYITKPLIPEEVLSRIKEALGKKEVSRGKVSLEEEYITGNSPEFGAIVEQIKIVSPVDMNVIIEGETGSGKEVVARSIHKNSKRAQGPFIAMDCGALPTGLVNSELFGHAKGAFTGAIQDKKGLFEQAHGGTLFLDEIGNLNMENQMQLLRVLQEKVITRLGEVKTRKVDVRLIVATNEDLLKEMEKGNLREDLYHRLNEFKIKVPPLRERREDKLLFADAFMRQAARRFDKQVNAYNEEVREILMNYSWPGNIRELKNVITRAVLLSGGGVITLKEIPEEVRTRKALQENLSPEATVDPENLALKEASGMAEKQAIIQALIQANHNKSLAARSLNIDRKTLYNKIKQYGITVTDPPSN